MVELRQHQRRVLRGEAGVEALEPISMTDVGASRRPRSDFRGAETVDPSDAMSALGKEVAFRPLLAPFEEAGCFSMAQRRPLIAQAPIFADGRFMERFVIRPPSLHAFACVLRGSVAMCQAEICVRSGSL